MGTNTRINPRNGTTLFRSFLIVFAFLLTLFTPATASAASSQVSCSTTSGNPDTFSWSTSGSTQSGATFTLKNLSVSQSMTANKQYGFTVTGASPSSFTASTSAASKDFGDYPFVIKGAAGSTFTVKLTSIQQTVLVLTSSCPGTLGSVQGNSTFLSQTITAPPSDTTIATTVSQTTQATSAAIAATTAITSAATSKSKSRGTVRADSATTASPPSSVITNKQVTASKKVTPRNKSKHNQSFWWWLKSPWLWFSIVLVVIPEFVKWQIRKSRKEIEEEFESDEHPGLHPIEPHHNFVVPDSLEHMETASFTEVLDELKDLSHEEQI